MCIVNEVNPKLMDLTMINTLLDVRFVIHFKLKNIFLKWSTRKEELE